MGIAMKLIIIALTQVYIERESNFIPTVVI